MTIKLVDVTRALRPGMTVFPGDPAFAIDAVTSVRPGDPASCALSRLEMSTHCGTHVDAPAHFVDGGATIDELPLERLGGLVRLVDLRGRGPAIDVVTLAELSLDGVSGLLLRTAGEEDPTSAPFDSAFAHLTPEAARWLVDERAVGLVGIDTLSIESAESERFEVHHTLLGASPPVIVVEGLDLRFAEPGDWELLCFPLRLEGADGAPARAILRRG